jgi:hypothetical protein
MWCPSPATIEREGQERHVLLLEKPEEKYVHYVFFFFLKKKKKKIVEKLCMKILRTLLINRV